MLTIIQEIPYMEIAELIVADNEQECLSNVVDVALTCVDVACIVDKAWESLNKHVPLLWHHCLIQVPGQRAFSTTKSPPVTA